jgi:hypothetical protein
MKRIVALKMIICYDDGEFDEVGPEMAIRHVEQLLVNRTKEDDPRPYHPTLNSYFLQISSSCKLGDTYEIDIKVQEKVDPYEAILRAQEK